MRTRPQRLLAYALIAIGVIMLLSRIGGADWLWLALISVIFLFAYVSRKTYNFLVAGGVLMGIAVGTLIDTSSGMLLSLAAGFFAIDRVEPKPNRWALYTAGIFAVLGALVALGSVGLLGSVSFALALLAVGAYLLYREGNKPAISRTPGYTSTDPESPAPTPETYNESYGNSERARPAETEPAAPSAVPLADTQRAQNQAETTKDAAEATPAAETFANQPPQAALSAEAETRLRQLMAWQRETAKAEGVPPYIVFTNDTLTKIAVANPQTPDELGSVKGVGPIKKSRYGETVLSVLRGDGSLNSGSDGDESSDLERAAS